MTVEGAKNTARDDPSAECHALSFTLLVHRDDIAGGGFVPLALYATQLALNLAWSPIFFMKHEIGFALADITGLPGLFPYFCAIFLILTPAHTQ
jgi:tryptophan-rich sensory protein